MSGGQAQGTNVPVTIQSAGPTGLAAASRVEATPALPNATAATIALGATCHHLILTVPAGVSITYSLKATADANSPVLDGTMVMHEYSPDGVSSLYVYAATDLRSSDISIRGW